MSIQPTNSTQRSSGCGFSFCTLVKVTAVVAVAIAALAHFSKDLEAPRAAISELSKAANYYGGIKPAFDYQEFQRRQEREIEAENLAENGLRDLLTSEGTTVCDTKCQNNCHCWPHPVLKPEHIKKVDCTRLGTTGNSFDCDFQLFCHGRKHLKEEMIQGDYSKGSINSDYSRVRISKTDNDEPSYAKVYLYNFDQCEV